MSDTLNPPATQVLVVGGGVAALEAALALHALAGERVEVTLLTRSTEYVARSMAVQQPFAYPSPERYPIADVVGDGVERIDDDLDWVDPVAKTVTTRSGQAVPYDVLLLACGAKPTVRYPHSITIDDRKLDELLHGMIQDIEGDYIHRVAYVAPERMGWPLPLYELALMTAQRAWAMGIELETILVTPEDRPLEVFGSTASHAVSVLLRERRVELHTSAHAEVPHRREIVINPGSRQLLVDRVISLPELFGPAIVGLPQDSFGFLPIDDHCRVHGAGAVFAAGDVADFPIKHGGIAAQMAVTAARAIAADAGAPVTAQPLDPVLRGMLLTGEHPRYLSAHRVGGHSYDSECSELPLWDPLTKVNTHYLAERLSQLRGTPSSIR